MDQETLNRNSEGFVVASFLRAQLSASSKLQAANHSDASFDYVSSMLHDAYEKVCSDINSPPSSDLVSSLDNMVDEVNELLESGGKKKIEKRHAECPIVELEVS